MDLVAAYAGFIAGTIILIPLVLTGRSIGLDLALVLSSGLYILLSIRRSRQTEYTNQPPTSSFIRSSWIAVLNILFTLGFLISILSYMSSLNIRTITFFMSIVLMASVTTFEIMKAHSSAMNSHIYLILSKILLISILLRWSEFFILPDLVGWDIAYHRYYVDKVLAVFGRVVYNSYIMIDYSKFPLYHLLILSEESLSSLQFRLAVAGTVGFLEALAPIYVYVLTCKMMNKNEGLLAALLVAVGNAHIYWGSLFLTPMALSLGLYPMFLSLVLENFFVDTEVQQTTSIKRKKRLGFALILMLQETIILTHTLGTWIYLITLGTLWAICRITKEIHEKTILFLFIILGMSSLGYWMLITDFFRYQVALMDRIFSEFSILRVYAGEASAIFSGLQYELNNLGMYTLYALGWIGSLNWLAESRLRDPKIKLIAIVGILLFLSYAFPLLLGSRAILPERWAAFIYTIVAIPAGSQLIRLGLTSNKKIACIALIIGFLTYFMITSSTANMETPIFDTKVPFWGYRRSDIYVANIAAQSSQRIVTDNFFAHNIMKYTLLKETDVLAFNDAKHLATIKEAILLRTGINLELPDVRMQLFAINYIMKFNESASPELVVSRNLLLSTGDVFLYGPRM